MGTCDPWWRTGGARVAQADSSSPTERVVARSRDPSVPSSARPVGAGLAQRRRAARSAAPSVWTHSSPPKGSARLTRASCASAATGAAARPAAPTPRMPSRTPGAGTCRRSDGCGATGARFPSLLDGDPLAGVANHTTELRPGGSTGKRALSAATAWRVRGRPGRPYLLPGSGPGQDRDGQTRPCWYGSHCEVVW